MAPTPPTLGELLHQSSASFPDHTALGMVGGPTFTYRMLQGRADTLATLLRDRGILHGDRVALLGENMPNWGVAFFAITSMGAVAVPILIDFPVSDIHHILRHAECSAAVVSRRLLPKVEEMESSSCPTLITMDDLSLHDRASGKDTVSRILTQGRGELQRPVAPARREPMTDLVPVNADDAGVLIYTSGTTGRPKGVLMSHRNSIAGGRNTTRAHFLAGKDRALCVLPIYHINGEMVTVMGPLVSRSSVVMPHRLSVGQFWNLIGRYGCTWFSVVPTIISYLLQRAEAEGFDAAVYGGLKQLRFGRSASAPLAPEMHRAFERRFGVPLIETMGLTETAAQILSNPLPPEPPRYGSPGRPCGNEAKIIDKNGRELPDGETGELMIRGDNVTRGYYKNPEATRAALEPDGWLHTGDLAYRDADGFYFIVGRLKEIIIKGGENIAPREIDEVLYQHPAVLEAAGFAVPDTHYGQEVMACVALKPGAACSAEELAAFCRQRLGDYKAPKQVWVLDSLPKGPSGKIQRLKLPELVGTGTRDEKRA